MALRRRFRGASAELRLYALTVLVLASFSVLLGRLWWEQVARGDQWRRRIAGKSEVTVRIPSVRGEIRDRNGITLVGNRASYEVDFLLRDMVSGYQKQQQIGHGSIPLTTYQVPVHGMMKNRKEADIVQIVNTGIVPRLQELELAKDYNAERLQKHYRTNTEVPYTYLEELDFPTIAKFSEHNVGLPGVEIAVRPVRQYIYGALAAHLLGYVGAPQNIEREPDVEKFTYYQADVDGKSQIEANMDQYLRGKPGRRILQRNPRGVIEAETGAEAPRPGANVYLTLDAKVQYIVEQALRHPSLGRAAAVVVDPNNGDILGMASVPSFDPNVFIPSVSSKDWDVLNKDEAVPLVNRAVSAFPPGSTFKIITAFAGLRKGLANNHYNCSGSLSYGAGRPMHCWIAEKGGSHGTIDLATALKVSCDCFFYQFGNAAKIEAMDDVGALLGIGKKYDIGLSDEKEGIMPGPDWLRLHYPQEKWSDAQTANASIGQGFVLASPLQMAMSYVPVANGGVVYEPRLVKRVLNPEGEPDAGKPVRDENGNIAVPEEPKIRADLRKQFSAAQIEIVRRGLWEVINAPGGTGAKARLKNVIVAGKTGSAQATDRGKKDTIAWFCCFAPFDKPRYVICTMVQGGMHGGSVAAPVAAHILEQCLAMDQGTYTPELTKLAGAHNPHPFTPIENLPDYKAAAAITLHQEDEESAESQPATRSRVQMDDNSSSSTREKAPRPDIRPAADPRGKVPQVVQPPKPDKRGLFERFFGRRPAEPAPAPQQRPPVLQPFRGAH